MAQPPVNDPSQAQKQGLPVGSKLDPDQEQAGIGSPSNRRKSPERPKEQSLGVHRDVYADSKRKR
jgi:hypothetical protein